MTFPATADIPQQQTTIPVAHIVRDGLLFVSVSEVANFTGVNYSNFTKKFGEAESRMEGGKKYALATTVVATFQAMPRFGASVDEGKVRELSDALQSFKSQPLVNRPISPDDVQPNPLPDLGSAGNPTPKPQPRPTPTIKPLNGHTPTIKAATEPQTTPRIELMGEGITYFLKSLVFMYVLYAVPISIEAYLQADLFGLLIQPDTQTHNIIQPRNVTWLFLPMTLILQLIFAALDVNQMTGKDTVKLIGKEVKTMNLALCFVFIFNLSTAEYRIFHGIEFDVTQHLGECFIRFLFGAVFPVMILAQGFVLAKRTGKK